MIFTDTMVNLRNSAARCLITIGDHGEVLVYADGNTEPVILRAGASLVYEVSLIAAVERDYPARAMLKSA